MSAIYIEQLAARLSGEFREMPRLRLTISQVERLCGIDRDTCAEVVALLVARSVLQRQDETITPHQRSGNTTLRIATALFNKQL